MFKKKCVYVHTWKENGEDCYKCLQRKTCCHVLKFLVRTKTDIYVVWRSWLILVCQTYESLLRERETISFFFNKFLRQSQSATPEPLSKKAKKILHQWHNRADSPLVDTVIHNYGIEWAFDFGPDSGILTVKDLVQEMTISSQEITLPAWSLLLSQRQGFLNHHLARVPINPNKQGTLEMRYEVH